MDKGLHRGRGLRSFFETWAKVTRWFDGIESRVCRETGTIVFNRRSCACDTCTDVGGIGVPEHGPCKLNRREKDDEKVNSGHCSGEFGLAQRMRHQRPDGR